MASMRASETLHVKLHKKRKNKEAMANARTMTVHTSYSGEDVQPAVFRNGIRLQIFALLSVDLFNGFPGYSHSWI